VCIRKNWHLYIIITTIIHPLGFGLIVGFLLRADANLLLQMFRTGRQLVHLVQLKVKRSSDLLQLLGHVVLGMLVLEVLFIRLGIGHLRLKWRRNSIRFSPKLLSTYIKELGVQI